MDQHEANAAKVRETLMVTKSQPPLLHEDLVPRGELVGYLREGFHRTLTLLSAPTGCGKTSLLAEWRAADAGDHPFAWLSLDPQDDDPVRFWKLVIGALDTAAPGVGARSLAALEAGADPVKFVLPPLINELAAMPTACAGVRPRLARSVYTTCTVRAIFVWRGWDRRWEAPVPGNELRRRTPACRGPVGARDTEDDSGATPCSFTQSSSNTTPNRTRPTPSTPSSCRS
ncbi:MAG: hypothetical protein AVDCRST_MAG01-01-185 [uncultured Rubrobacteraceae bacterium]|uniref:Transcriptional activator of maltose regulon, MalT n=1 Tax=uncultured Rubrobacteraceae bacterium TaxID=349277 RepID=A0A6J4NCW3_9ACTN|nr:MAG: hypothetical protein AVDCRST_MAG01-01-185 [uncultured Rubrobacteraceae bacterium]